MPELRQQDWLHDGADVVFIPARLDACAAPRKNNKTLKIDRTHFGNKHVSPMKICDVFFNLC